MKLSEAEWDVETPKVLVNPIPAPFQWCSTRWSRCSFQLRNFRSCFLLEAREKLSLWGLLFPVRDKIEVKVVIQYTLACHFEVFCDVLPVIGLRPQVPNSPLPLTHGLLTSPSGNQPSVVLMPGYSPTEAKLSGDKPLLSHCLEPALVPLPYRDFISSCPMENWEFGGVSGWMRWRQEKKT